MLTLKTAALSFPSTNMYIGAPGCGKTYAAFYEANLVSKQAGIPIVGIFAVAQSAELPVGEPPVWVDAMSHMWFDYLSGERVLFTVVESREQLAHVFRAIKSFGSAAVVVDESAEWLNSRATSRPLASAFRHYRHLRWWLACTTQVFNSDMPRWLMACEPGLSVFRTSDEPSLLRLRELLSLDASDIPDQRFVRASF